MLKCPIDKMDDVFEEIAKIAKLYLPVDIGESIVYKPWEKGDVWSDAVNTSLSPKELFFPQTENLMEFKTEGKSIEVIDTRRENGPFVVFGVRACDVKSIEVLDRVFLAEPVDSYYAKRREEGIIISTACTRPAETCFCTTFDVSPQEPSGDISSWKTDEEVFFKANTEKGENFLKKITSYIVECDEDRVREQKEKILKIMDKLPLKNLKADAFGGGKTDEFFCHPAWDELSGSCLGCGACTFVCPTCQCYDIKDFNTGSGIIRFRCWDSCMYSDFTKMAHGNNRHTQKERFRQRFMHKLVYYPENNEGIFGCVGCGRCIAKCPVSMNIVKVMKKIGGK
ncbi:MAG: 4Fe-4S ferredoxin [Ruminococcaceae bacterium]|nr:4Fe-4S ferredoxin [Oscillospiraceae bacterium]